MKVIQIKEFGGPEVLQTVEIEEPTPNENEVKVKLYATGINPSESYTITGNYAYRIPDLPYVPGSDGAGEIEELGANVTHLKVGDRVFMSGVGAKRNTGTYAEKVVFDGASVYPLPSYLSFKEGAGLGIPAFTAYRALFQKAQLKAGETVLIHGASGAVGTLAVQMAKVIGGIVIGTSSTEAGRAQILENGADYAIPHVNATNIQEILDLTDERGPDVIIEFLANENLEIDTKIIADNGRVIIVGSRATIEFTPRNLMTNEATVTGMTVSAPSKEAMKEMRHGLLSLLKVETLKPVIGNEFSLDEGPAAHKSLMETSGNGRTIFNILSE